jgi:hypothetical protein
VPAARSYPPPRSRGLCGRGILTSGDSRPAGRSSGTLGPKRGFAQSRRVRRTGGRRKEERDGGRWVGKQNDKEKEALQTTHHNSEQTLFNLVCGQRMRISGGQALEVCWSKAASACEDRGRLLAIVPQGQRRLLFRPLLQARSAHKHDEATLAVLPSAQVAVATVSG